MGVMCSQPRLINGSEFGMNRAKEVKINLEKERDGKRKRNRKMDTVQGSEK